MKGKTSSFHCANLRKWASIRSRCMAPYKWDIFIFEWGSSPYRSVPSRWGITVVPEAQPYSHTEPVWPSFAKISEILFWLLNFCTSLSLIKCIVEYKANWDKLIESFFLALTWLMAAVVLRVLLGHCHSYCIVMALLYKNEYKPHKKCHIPKISHYSSVIMWNLKKSKSTWMI